MMNNAEDEANQELASNSQEQCHIPMSKRAKPNSTLPNNKSNIQFRDGILKINNNNSRSSQNAPHLFIIANDSEDYWDQLNTINNNNNIQVEEHWQQNNLFPQNVSRPKTQKDCSLVNLYWTSCCDQNNKDILHMYHTSIKRIRFIQDEIVYDHRYTQSLISYTQSRINDSIKPEYQGVAKQVRMIMA
jgi:hypothetical protein